MFTNKIFCFGDGFATGHIWPEWPQILSAIVGDHYQVVNIAGIGAGQEFLISELIALGDEIIDQFVIFQWPIADRFDKLIVDSSWENIISQDEQYHFNYVKGKTGTWWLSSASKLQTVQNYHMTYVQKKQHTVREQTFYILLKNYLEQKQCKFVFTSTDIQDQFSKKTEYINSRGTEIQPAPIIHYEFLLNVLLPQLDIKFDAERANKLKNLIKNTQWTPYFFDRQQLWDDIVKKI